MLESDRVRTFEADGEETVVISAGVDAHNQRTIYAGHLDGRFAVVPVEAIDDDWDRTGYTDELEYDDIEVVGSSVFNGVKNPTTVTLLEDDDLAAQRTSPGVYALIRIPFDRR